ncbi:MAG: hypothetical protein JWP61_2079 [Friedmanniella sp.]|nr:hypothetical protein [Friedmanniella sp.]
MRKVRAEGHSRDGRLNRVASSPYQAAELSGAGPRKAGR